MIAILPFEDELQELQTLPRAVCYFEGFKWYVRVFPGTDSTERNIAIVTIEQDFEVQDYLRKIFNLMQLSVGDQAEVERRFMFRDIEDGQLSYG